MALPANPCAVCCNRGQAYPCPMEKYQAEQKAEATERRGYRPPEPAPEPKQPTLEEQITAPSKRKVMLD